MHRLSGLHRRVLQIERQRQRAAACAAACLLCCAFPAAAQDSDGDGLSDAEEVSRARIAAFGPRQRITAAALGPASIFAADLDGDGDKDVLSASWIDDAIAWYENRLSQPGAAFGPRRAITTAALGALSVFATDLDGDGDPDALSASIMNHTIAWHENRLDEASTDFGPLQPITEVADEARSVFAADLDGDGDPDVLSASWNDDTIAWYENRLDEASGDFGPQRAITRTADGALAVVAADLDGDGDPDVVSAAGVADAIAWYENRLDEASGDFGPARVIAMRNDRGVAAAEREGVRVRLWDCLFYAAFAVLVTHSVSVAGVFVVFSYLIIPPACATLFIAGFGRQTVLAWLIGVVTTVAGLMLSVVGDLPTGPSLVACFGAALVVSVVVRNCLRIRIQSTGVA